MPRFHFLQRALVKEFGQFRLPAGKVVPVMLPG
jgi:hypothetical protein